MEVRQTRHITYISSLQQLVRPSKPPEQLVDLPNLHQLVYLEKPPQLACGHITAFARLIHLHLKLVFQLLFEAHNMRDDNLDQRKLFRDAKRISRQ